MLVNYSCSESSGEDSGAESADGPLRKRIKLPSATELLKDASRNGATGHVNDNPALHGGRKRAFAHERGNWASHCYFHVPSGRFINALRRAIEEYCRSAELALDLQCIEDIHLSLTKTFVLQHHWIRSFVDSVRSSVGELKSDHLHSINFNSIKVFENEDNTRTFIALGVCEEDYSFLNEIVGKLNICLADFKLPPFYDPPDYHASFLWCLGSRGEDLKKILGKINIILQDLISSERTNEDTLDPISCDTLNCKIGNQLYKIRL